VSAISRRTLLTALPAAAWGATRLVRAQSGDSLGAARDAVYRALELLSERSTQAEVASAIRLLRNALDQDPGFGDAHYYWALCLQRLNQEPQMQRFHLSEAERYASDALRDRRDPFVLAVPRIYDNLSTFGQKWALVVGISRFRPDGGAENLQFADKDAEALDALLTDPEIGRFSRAQVTLLTNDRATTPAIKARLNYIATRAKPEDLVVLYISTHGSARADDLRQVSYLYSYDTDVRSRDQIFGTALAMVDVAGILNNRCVAQRTVCIFDTCHSGAGASARALTPDDMNRLKAGAGRYVLSSCAADQQAYEDAGHGFFTASLIEQLRVRRGCVRIRDLFVSVHADVRKRARDRFGREQTPVMVSSESAADIVIGAPTGTSPDACVAPAADH
jgi:hypothetical protein